MQTLDQRALFAAVLAHPEEDTPRLMLADALEETDPARAELIRVQCELARLDDLEGITIGGKYSWEDYRKWSGLRDREADLLETHGARWRRVACTKCGGTGDSRGMNLSHTFERCKTCAGTGDMGGLTWAIVPDLLPSGGIYKWNPPEVEFARGFPHVVRCARLVDAVVDAVGDGCLNCGVNRPGANSYNVCSKCGMTVGVSAVATPWFAAVVAHHPTVEQVIPGDREPRADGINFVWFNSDRTHRHDEDAGAAEVPGAIWPHLQQPPHTRGVTFAARELALATLGRAIIAFARKEPSA